MALNTFNIGTKTYNYDTDTDNPLALYDEYDRIGIFCQYLKMCGDQEEMQADGTILKYPHVFSLRRNYQDDPFMGLKPDTSTPSSALQYRPDGGWGLANQSFEDNIYFGALHSYTGENDILVNFGLQNGKKEMLRKLALKELPAIRSDLFQIFWAKGTDVRQWIIGDFEHNVVPELQRRVSSLLEINQSATVMDAAYSFKAWMKENSEQKRMHYSTKDCFLDLSLRFPEAYDPESYLEPATGALKGLAMYSGQKAPAGKKRTPWVLEFAEKCKAHPDYPLVHTHYQRQESQWCYSYKHIMISTDKLKRKPKK